MVKQHWKFDLLATAVFLLVLLAYFGIFGDSGVFFYLIHTPYLLVLLPTLVVIFFNLIKKRLLLVSIAILLASVFYIEFFAVSAPKLSPSAQIETNFRVCSWNTAFFFKWGVDSAVQQLIGEACDAIMLQEVWNSETKLEYLNKLVATYFPGKALYAVEEFAFILPASANAQTKPEVSTSKGHARMQFELNERTITLINVHLWTPLAARPFLEQNKVTVIDSATIRQKEQSELLDELQSLSEETQVVAIGDFNTMQNGKTLRDIQKIGTGRYTLIQPPLAKSRNTYPVSYKLLRLDYAFVSRGLEQSANLSTICTFAGSDHCLLILDLML